MGAWDSGPFGNDDALVAAAALVAVANGTPSDEVPAAVAVLAGGRPARVMWENRLG
jgi:hypothetical protein